MLNTINRNLQLWNNLLYIFLYLGGIMKLWCPRGSFSISIYMLLHNDAKKNIWMFVATLLIHGSGSHSVEVKSQKKIESNSNPVRRIKTPAPWRMRLWGLREWPVLAERKQLNTTYCMKDLGNRKCNIQWLQHLSLERFVSKQKKKRQARWSQRREDWGEERTKWTVLLKTNGLRFKL